jgi:hypothetical protein
MDRRLLACAVLLAAPAASAQQLYELPRGVETRWYSFENPDGRPAWFGEGELKVYLDGDREWPTLVGTGTEDLVGSAWGLGRFDHLYQGAPLTDEKDGVWGFYRYHVADPVYFEEAVRVTLQQIAGASVSDLRKLPEADRPELVRDHRPFDPAAYARPEDESRWENFETPQDVCATAYWYQTLPSPRWPALEPYAERVKDLGR